MRRNLLQLLFVFLSFQLLLGCVSAPKNVDSAPVGGFPTLSVTFIINNGSAIVSTPIKVRPGTTAISLFKEYATLETRDYGKAGAYIRSVNGLRENQDGNGHFWQYYIDGVYAKVGASQFTIDRPMAIELRYEIPGKEAYQ